jgi:hypothetical protein
MVVSLRVDTMSGTRSVNVDDVMQALCVVSEARSPAKPGYLRTDRKLLVTFPTLSGSSADQRSETAGGRETLPYQGF